MLKGHSLNLMYYLFPMSIFDNSLSLSQEIRYRHSSQFVFYNIPLFYSLIEVGFFMYKYSLYYTPVCVLFHSLYNLDQYEITLLFDSYSSQYS
jgi:hypothetical protein